MKRLFSLVLSILIVLPTIVWADTNTNIPDQADSLQSLTVNADEEAYIEDPETDEFGSIVKDYTAYIEKLTKNLTLPEIGDLTKLIKEKNPKKQHPRLFARQSDFEELKKRIETDNNTKILYTKIKEYGNGLLTQPYTNTKLNNDNLARSRETLDRVILLGMLYRIEKEQKYVDFIVGQLEVSLAKCLQWPETDQLQSAEMTFAASVAYDWFYDGLTKSQADFIKSFIIVRLNKVYTYYYPTPKSFAIQVNNWNAVCNGSYGVAALALGDEESELCVKVLYAVVKHITLSIRQMSPHGGFPEGPGYWAYQTQYLVHFMASLFSAIGTDFGLSNIKGFVETAYYPMYITGPTFKSFNYADAGEEFPVCTYLYWFAKQFNIDGLQNLANTIDPSGVNYSSWKEKSLDCLHLLWDVKSDTKYYTSKPLNKFYDGRQPVGTLRTSWEDRKATFVAFKGGYNQLSHGNLDMGTFVLDSLGQRFVSDLGGEAYSLEGYWDFSSNGKRWRYFTQRAEGHNLFVINPGQYPDQNPLSKAEIEEKSGDLGYGIVNLTDAYAADAISAKRGIALVNDNILVRDELKLKKTSNVVWGINTIADKIEISPNGKSAILAFNTGECMKVYLLNPSNLKFEVMAAQSMSYVNFSGQKTFPNVKRLVVKGNITEDNITVQFSPFMKGEMASSAFLDVKPLIEWKNGNFVKSGGIASNIYLDGKPLPLFNSNKFGYTVYLPKNAQIPNVMVDFNRLIARSTITDTNELGNYATIQLKPFDPRLKAEIYTIKFEEQKTFGLPKDVQTIVPKNVTASDVAIDPKRTLDHRYDTSWSANGKHWLCYEFDGDKAISTVAIAFFMGTDRREVFSIEYSNDNENWTSLYDGFSSGLSKELEQFEFEDITPKYIRISTNGSSLGTWANIAETVFYKAE